MVASFGSGLGNAFCGPGSESRLTPGSKLTFDYLPC